MLHEVEKSVDRPCRTQIVIQGIHSEKLRGQSEASRDVTELWTYLSSHTVFRRCETHELGDLRLLLRRVRGRHLVMVYSVRVSN